MALTEVKRYYSRWKLDTHQGKIILYDTDNNVLDNRNYGDANEFQLVVGMLRNEKPLYFSDTLKHLRTGALGSGEPVGEEEG